MKALKINMHYQTAEQEKQIRWWNLRRLWRQWLGRQLRPEPAPIMAGRVVHPEARSTGDSIQEVLNKKADSHP